MPAADRIGILTPTENASHLRQDLRGDCTMPSPHTMRVRGRLSVRGKVRTNFERRSGDRTRVDGGVRVRVRVRVSVSTMVRVTVRVAVGRILLFVQNPLELGLGLGFGLKSRGLGLRFGLGSGLGWRGSESAQV